MDKIKEYGNIALDKIKIGQQGNIKAISLAALPITSIHVVSNSKNKS